MTDGMKSTEFWLVVGAGAVLAAFIIVGYAMGDVTWDKALEALQSEIWAVVSYVLGRSVVKAAGNLGTEDVKDKILEAIAEMQQEKPRA